MPKMGTREVQRSIGKSGMVDEKKDGQYVRGKGKETEIGGNKFREVGRYKII